MARRDGGLSRPPLSSKLVSLNLNLIQGVRHLAPVPPMLLRWAIKMPEVRALGLVFSGRIGLFKHANLRGTLVTLNASFLLGPPGLLLVLVLENTVSCPSNSIFPSCPLRFPRRTKNTGGYKKGAKRRRTPPTRFSTRCCQRHIAETQVPPGASQKAQRSTHRAMIYILHKTDSRKEQTW